MYLQIKGDLGRPALQAPSSVNACTVADIDKHLHQSIWHSFSPYKVKMIHRGQLT